MKSLVRWLGSLTMAAPLLLVIAIVLAWGTIYETRFGTAAVQQFIYRAWWFQALLGFLAVNLAVAALQRYPWQRRHAPFVLAHLGIILLLFGGILGGRLGIEGQLIIPEGAAERVMQLPINVLVMRAENPGIPQTFPTRFETTAWNHAPHALFTVPLKDRTMQVVVDRYYPDAVVEEEICETGEAEHPAIRVRISDGEHHDEMWLLARDPERFGVRWGEVHVLFLEPASEQQWAQLTGATPPPPTARGTLTIALPKQAVRQEIAVPRDFKRPLPLNGTPYTITFKEYFADFALTEQGVASRSDQPNNPAIAFTLSGPEGTDAYLLFALHPDFEALHGQQHQIHAHVTYTHPAGAGLPPQAIAVLRRASGELRCLLTDAEGARQGIPCAVGQTYTHEPSGYQFAIAAYAPRANVMQRVTNRSNDVRAEMVHLTAQDGGATAQAWVGLRDTASLVFPDERVTVEYRPAVRELPFTVRLLDFRKTDYPGTRMAAGFESDVELADPQRGITLRRTISMNNPLKYRGFSLFQSSYIMGPTETTVLSVRNDPGTPFVYAGFMIIVLGVVWMFIQRRKTVSTL